MCIYLTTEFKSEKTKITNLNTNREYITIVENFNISHSITELLSRNQQIYSRTRQHFKICCCSVTRSCPVLCHSMDCSTPELPVLHHLPELAQTNVHWVSDAIQPEVDAINLCPPLLQPSIFPSIRVFFNESTLCIRWPKYWSFSFSPSNEYSGSVSFRIDWFDLFEVQGTLKSLLQHHSLKTSILWRSAFFMVQLSYSYMTTGKTVDLTIWTFVGKMMSLLFNMLSRFVKIFF